MQIRRLKPLLLAAVLLLSLFAGCTYEQNSRASRIPKNEYDPLDYSLLPDGTVAYPGAIQGIDVASHQGEIDWPAVRRAGIEFAIIQIGYRGYTAGGVNIDERFEANFNGAKEAGLLVGVYFYSQAVSKAEAMEEAEFVLDALNGRELDLPVFFDWEEVSEGRTKDRGTFAVGDYALEFCRKIAGSGYTAGVYFNQSYGYTIMQLEALTEYAFWLAEYRSYQSFSYDVGFWQYTGDGRVDGIRTTVDRNLMYPIKEQGEQGEQVDETAVP